ncbi:MAG: TetR/AcrR family transcriptional regulator [Rhodospirillales bacterium]
MNDLPDTRLRNMDARRQRILDEACRMLADGGTGGLTLRGLAENSGVTVPTIYNLVGCKDQVVTSLIAAALDRLDEALLGLPSARGIARAEAAVGASVTLFFGEPGRYGAVFRALQEMQGSKEDRLLGPLFRRAGEVYCQAVSEAQKDGDLRGRLRAVPLGHHILHAQIEGFRLWGVGTLAAPVVRARAFYALYVSLLADATKPVRKRLLEQLRESESILDT